jgi:hypothetical protein
MLQSNWNNLLKVLSSSFLMFFGRENPVNVGQLAKHSFGIIFNTSGINFVHVKLGNFSSNLFTFLSMQLEIQPKQVEFINFTL